LRTSDFTDGAVYAVRRTRFSDVILVLMIASDRQYGIWHDPYEENYRLFEYDQGMLVDSRGVAAVPIPKEIEQELLGWYRGNLVPLRLPSLAKLYNQYTPNGDDLRETKGSPGIRWTEEMLGDLLILPPSTIIGDLSFYINMMKGKRVKDAHQRAQTHNAEEELKARFNAAFPALTQAGVTLDLVIDSPHGAHSRLSIEDMELLADFINQHSPRKVSS
jgi:hypothetical protein